MKKLLITALAVFAVSAAMAQLPNVKVKNAKGAEVSTSTILDAKKPTIISFWSTTCKPCILELNTINDQLVDWLDEADFQVVAVSIDDVRSSSKAKSLAAGNGWDDFTVLYDENQELKRAMNVTIVPQVYVLDASGKIVYQHTGYTAGSEMELLEQVKALQ
jgi:peroxiredoxin